MRKKKLTIDPDHTTFLGTLEPDSMQHRTFRAFAEASAKHALLTDRMGDPKFEGKNGLVPDKYREEWVKLCHDADRAGEVMFRAFDVFTRTTKHTIHVPADEMRQVVYDALISNVDAMPDFLILSGPERGHTFRALADKMVDVIRGSQAQVVEAEADPPYCDECLDKLA